MSWSVTGVGAEGEGMDVGVVPAVPGAGVLTSELEP